MYSVKALYQCRRVVAIGGGHGLGRVMASLGFLGRRLSGIVATTDDGGSTGRLREASGCIAWGDLRNCLNQLCSDSPNLARILFEYRYKDSGELSGHNLGNLILLAADQMCVRPMDAINLIRQMLQVDAELIPMSEEPARLSAYVAGEEIIGESSIDALPICPERLQIVPKIKPTAEALKRICQSELIVLGPGSFMTSILPALLIPEIATAVRDSKALTVFVANIAEETSSVQSLSIEQKLAWMADMTGITPDTLLWPKERGAFKSIQPVSSTVVTVPLADSFQNTIHSRKALRHVLDDLMLQRLSKQS